MTSATLDIRELVTADLRAVERLLYDCYRLHTHLDWYEAMDWLHQSSGPLRLAWQNNRLAGLMAASSPLNGSAWLRIVALADSAPLHGVIDALWDALLPELRAAGIRSLSVLMMRDWIEPTLRHLRFRYVEDVVSMERHVARLPDAQPHRAQLRPILAADLPAISAVDHLAFDTPWQMAPEDLREALQVASIFTLAELDGETLGYQISTQYGDSGHLARLAVAPAHQGQGVGSLLVHDVLRQFLSRGISSMSVNTQAHNLTSQRLYRSFGFRRNGYDPPVWTFNLDWQ